MQGFSTEFILLVQLLLVAIVTGSVGDRTYVYHQCNKHCDQRNCHGKNLQIFSANQPVCERLLQWSCKDECKYSCMWTTVEAFHKDGLAVPQFHGKWPFLRLFGMQEPASVIFSVLNGLAHISILKYRKYIPASTPMYYVWHASSLTAMNAWFWSTIFHAKDTDFTEKMDYFCAFSIVLFSTFTLACRVLGTEKRRRLVYIGLVCLVLYIRHICYLSFNSFDYGYNMKVNIGVAVFNMIGWLGWCFTMREHGYVWKAVASIVGIQCLLSLELWDFPPIWWTFDAHSLWHGGTAPLCLLWYSFIIDDGRYLMKRKYETLPQKLD